MKRSIALIALSIFVCTHVATADTLSVSHGYLAEVAPVQRSSVIAPDSPERSSEGFTGFYQGQFNLKNVVEHPRVSCTAITSYPAELFVLQEGRKIKVQTPANVTLTGRIRKRGKRFRAVVSLIDGPFTRKVKIRGRQLADTAAIRVVSIEKVILDDNGEGATELLCKFVHGSFMTRISK